MTPDELQRYGRHLMTSGLGEAGQEKICAGKVLVAGTGGLGSPALYYLAAAGTGTIGVLDNDVVDITNLQRQIVHSTPDIGTAKVDSAIEKLRRLNPGVNFNRINTRLTSGNAREIIGEYDFIIDATDNTLTKYLINDTCVALGKAFSHGAVCGWEGHTFTYVPGAPCLRCLFDMDKSLDEIPRNNPVGLIGTLPGTVGIIQATEALKYITGAGKTLTGRLLRINLLTMEMSTLRFGHRSHCICNCHNVE